MTKPKKESKTKRVICYRPGGRARSSAISRPKVPKGTAKGPLAKGKDARKSAVRPSGAKTPRIKKVKRDPVHDAVRAAERAFLLDRIGPVGAAGNRCLLLQQLAHCQSRATIAGAGARGRLAGTVAHCMAKVFAPAKKVGARGNGGKEPARQARDRGLTREKSSAANSEKEHIKSIALKRTQPLHPAKLNYVLSHLPTGVVIKEGIAEDDAGGRDVERCAACYRSIARRGVKCRSCHRCFHDHCFLLNTGLRGGEAGVAGAANKANDEDVVPGALLGERGSKVRTSACQVYLSGFIDIEILSFDYLKDLIHNNIKEEFEGEMDGDTLGNRRATAPRRPLFDALIGDVRRGAEPDSSPRPSTYYVLQLLINGFTIVPISLLKDREAVVELLCKMRQATIDMKRDLQKRHEAARAGKGKVAAAPQYANYRERGRGRYELVSPYFFDNLKPLLGLGSLYRGREGRPSLLSCILARALGGGMPTRVKPMSSGCFLALPGAALQPWHVDGPGLSGAGGRATLRLLRARLSMAQCSALSEFFSQKKAMSEGRAARRIKSGRMIATAKEARKRTRGRPQVSSQAPLYSLHVAGPTAGLLARDNGCKNELAFKAANSSSEIEGIINNDRSKVLNVFSGFGDILERESQLLQDTLLRDSKILASTAPTTVVKTAVGTGCSYFTGDTVKVNYCGPSKLPRQGGGHADSILVDVSTSLRPYAINVFVPLVDIKANANGTEFRPMSHLSFGDLAELTRLFQQEADVEQAAPGSDRDTINWLDVLAPLLDTLPAADARHLRALAREGAATPAEILRHHAKPLSPAVPLGHALLFDYRVWHRGLGYTAPPEAKSEASILELARPCAYVSYSQDWYTDTYNFGKARFAEWL